MKQHHLTEEQRIERVLKNYKNQTVKYHMNTGFWKGFIERWEDDGGLYSKKIIKSLTRQVNRKRKHDSNYPEWQGVNLELEHLFSHISWCISELKRPPMRPSERSEVIDRIKSSAEQIIRDMAQVGLPFSSTNYFTSGEFESRYWRVLHAIGLGEQVDQSEEYDWDAFLAWIAGGRIGDIERPPTLKLDAIKDQLLQAEYEHTPGSVELLVTEVLVKLADKSLLNSLALPAVVTKTASQKFERYFMIRKLTQYFQKKYSENLYQLTANLCVLMFDDESIDMEAVKSALDGYEANSEYEQEDFTYHQRIGEILT